jgi:serine/threonine protein kinase
MSSQPLPSDSESRSDEYVAGMERAIESGRTIPDGPDEFEHYRCYQFVESLTAPLRAVLSHPMSMIELPDYETLREIGRGGMGVVYCGIHRQTRRMDAIKVIRPDRLAIHSEGHAGELQWRF